MPPTEDPELGLLLLYTGNDRPLKAAHQQRAEIARCARCRI
jgi:hypothetical protein